MRARNIILRVVLANLLLLIQGCSLATDNSNAPSLVDAEKLVNALKLSEGTLLGASVPFLLEEQQRRHEQRSDELQRRKFLSCLKSVETGEYLKIYSDEILEKMSETEVLNAISFFESGVGQKIVENGLVDIGIAFGLQLGESRRDLSAAEDEEARRFQATSAGEKLMSRSIFVGAPIQKRLLAAGNRIIDDCRRVAGL